MTLSIYNNSDKPNRIEILHSPNTNWCIQL